MNSGELSFGVKLDNIMLEKSTLTTIQDNQHYNSIKAYPNPSNTGFLNIISNGEQIEFILYNALGNEVTKGAFRNKIQINLTDYSKGIYFFKYSVNNSIFTTKIIYY